MKVCDMDCFNCKFPDCIKEDVYSENARYCNRSEEYKKKARDYIQLSLQGFAAKVKVGDSLLDPLLKSDNGANIWYTPMYLWQNR